MKVENIQKATVNGRKVKIFRVRFYGVYVGQYSAPVKTANKDLLKWAEAVIHDRFVFSDASSK